MNFTGKVVIVTGASSGIGASISISFAIAGADVVLVGRNEENLKAVAEKCGANEKHLIIKADVANDDDTKAIVTKTIEKYGKIDILVNNAGLLNSSTIMDGTILDAFDIVMKINLRSAVHLTMLTAPYLAKTKGNIINISSICGLTTRLHKEILPYAISKAGMEHFMKGAAAELAPYGIRVNNINPGPVKTNIFNIKTKEAINVEIVAQATALKKYSDPNEVADLCLFIASGKAGSITGSSYVIDNGLMVTI